MGARSSGIGAWPPGPTHGRAYLLAHFLAIFSLPAVAALLHLGGDPDANFHPPQRGPPKTP